MKTIDPNEVLPQVQDMLYALSWEAVNRLCLPQEQRQQAFDEALREAYFSFMKACRTYGRQRKRGVDWMANELPFKNEPDDTKFSTWCHFMVSCRLKTFNTNTRHLSYVEGTELKDEIAESVAARPHRSPALEAMDELSGDAREMVSLLLETPGDLFGIDITSPCKLLSKVKAYMVKHCGKSKEQVEQSHQEIAAVFRRVWSEA